jgi:hypothetical protein
MYGNLSINSSAISPFSARRLNIPMIKGRHNCNQFWYGSTHCTPTARVQCWTVMHTKSNLIRTTVDPKIFRANYRTITVRDGGEFETTATTEIIDEDYDPKAAKPFIMRVMLDYPRRSTSTQISLAKIVTQDGKVGVMKPFCYELTQADFDAVMRGEVINVPARN